MKKHCENCGCKVYKGYCTNCCEEYFIAEQYNDLDMPVPESIVKKIEEYDKEKSK